MNDVEEAGQDVRLVEREGVEVFADRGGEEREGLVWDGGMGFCVDQRLVTVVCAVAQILSL